jgi:hypothetical protein
MMTTSLSRVVLPYWVRDHIHHRTLSLMRAWLEWKSKNGYKPGTLCPRGIPSGEWWKVEEMGWAYLRLEKSKQCLIAQYLSGGGREHWRQFRKSTGLSTRGMKRLLLELQDQARARGILELEDQELALAAREQGPPRRSRC